MIFEYSADATLYSATIFYIAGMTAYIIYLFRQNDKMQNTGFYLTVAGAVLHIISILARSIVVGSIPVHNLHQTLSVSGLALAWTFILFRKRLDLKILGIFATPLLVFIMVSTLLIPAEPAEYETILKGFWIVCHIVLIFMGEAALALACGAGILYLLQEKQIKSKRQGFFFRRLPSLDRLDSASYTLVATGFALLTFGLVTGFIYAKGVWGKFWSWDPKEIWSMVTWLVYAILLHCRLTVGWQGRKSAIMTIIGFAVLLFTFIGVNFLIGGHHQGFTK